VACGIPVRYKAGVPEAERVRTVEVEFMWKALVEETMPLAVRLVPVALVKLRPPIVAVATFAFQYKVISEAKDPPPKRLEPAMTCLELGTSPREFVATSRVTFCPEVRIFKVDEGEVRVTAPVKEFKEETPLPPEQVEVAMSPPAETLRQPVEP
jgi:hypothetical protein